MIMNVDFVWWLITTLLIAGMAGWNYVEAKKQERLAEIYQKHMWKAVVEKEELEAILHERRGKYD